MLISDFVGVFDHFEDKTRPVAFLTLKVNQFIQFNRTHYWVKDDPVLGCLYLTMSGNHPALGYLNIHYEFIPFLKPVTLKYAKGYFVGSKMIN